VTALALGEVHACALLTDHTVRCWGNNVYGQLGNGTPSDTWTPVTVLAADGHPLSDVTAITAGRNHTCALKGDRTVWCWGHDLYGELGTPNVPYFQSLVPVQVTGIGNAVAIAAGAIHTCAVLADQTVKCWGNDGYGQLGNGTVSYAVPGPLPVNAIGPDGNPLGGAIGIAAGAAHTCARMIDGTVWCWGYNEAGQLGNGTTTDSSIAVVWPGLTTTTAISAGHSSTCALLADQTVRCWGGYQSLATFGSLAPANSLTMAPVPGITTATALTSGAFSACAVLADQTVRCWGDNESGQLGNGTLTDSATPVTVTTADGGSLTGVTALAVGPAAYSTCAVLADQTVRCWGSNVFGQLGNNTATDSLIPVTVVAGP
jgi:alpha-tubulin suppressor-like RCC1 family protein